MRETIKSIIGAAMLLNTTLAVQAEELDLASLNNNFSVTLAALELKANEESRHVLPLRTDEQLEALVFQCETLLNGSDTDVIIPPICASESLPLFDKENLVELDLIRVGGIVPLISNVLLD